MKNFLVLIISIGGLLTTQSCTEGKAAQKINVISVEEMSQIIKMDDVQLVDVRRPEEVAQGHIAGAENIAYYGDEWNLDITHLDKEKPVVVYCRSGKRSSKCRKILEKEGFTKIYDLKGGVLQWEKEGQKLVKN